MSWLSELFSGGKDPSKEANKYLQQVPGAVSPYYTPYIQQGQNANNILQGQYGQLINDPNALFAKFGQGYQQSPGYQFKLNQALQSGTNAAAAGGMAGSPAHQQQNMQLANDIASQDYNDYINHILGLYGLGLQGEQGLGEQGFKASLGYGDILGTNLANQANLAYEGRAAQNANKSNLWNNIISTGATIGGTVLGGPIGGALAYNMMNKNNSNPTGGASGFLGKASGPNLLPNRSYG